MLAPTGRLRYPGPVRVSPALIGIVFAATLWGSLGVAEQPIDPLAPHEEQQIELLHPGGVQELERVDPQDQDIGRVEPVSRGKRVASGVGKVVVGVLAVGVAVGAAAASLLFL